MAASKAASSSLKLRGGELPTQTLVFRPKEVESTSDLTRSPSPPIEQNSFVEDHFLRMIPFDLEEIGLQRARQCEDVSETMVLLSPLGIQEISQNAYSFAAEASGSEPSNYTHSSQPSDVTPDTYGSPSEPLGFLESKSTYGSSSTALIPTPQFGGHNIPLKDQMAVIYSMAYDAMLHVRTQRKRKRRGELSTSSERRKYRLAKTRRDLLRLRFQACLDREEALIGMIPVLTGKPIALRRSLVDDEDSGSGTPLEDQRLRGHSLCDRHFHKEFE